MDNRQKLFQVLADIFKVDAASINEAASADTIAAWDSLAIVGLVTELQDVFGVEFDILEIAECRNAAIIKSILVDKGVEF